MLLWLSSGPGRLWPCPHPMSTVVEAKTHHTVASKLKTKAQWWSCISLFDGLPESSMSQSSLRTNGCTLSGCRPLSLCSPFTCTEGQGAALTTSPLIHVTLETQDVPPLEIQSLQM